VNCTICFLEYPLSEMSSLYCEHWFCIDCWRQFLNVKINDGNIKVITCPARDCSLQLDEEMVEDILSDNKYSNLLKKYHRLVAQSYIDDSSNMRWCPGKGCDRAIRVKLLKDKDVKCECGTKFCFGCGNIPHSPSDCKMLREWLSKCSLEGEDTKWMATFTKECPNCAFLIHKEGGCQYMTCSHCSHHFCWVCLGNFDHINHSCNKFKEETGVDPNSERARINKFIHFYNRYMTHEQSSKLEDKLLKIAEETMQTLAGEGHSWIDVQFVKHATLTLMEARNMLKYTYTYGYFLPEHVNRDLFEFLQSDLEAGTERLSGSLEANEHDRLKIINNTEYVKQRIKNLSEGLAENDITGGKNEEKSYVNDVEKYEGWIYTT